MNEQPVTYEVRDGIGVISLNRPDKGNAMTLALCAGLFDAFDRADRDDEVGVVLLRGNGRHFCVGADLEKGFHSKVSGPTEEQAEFVDRFGSIAGVPRDAGGVVTMRIAAMLKPVVAAVRGAAVGGGATMLLPCDLRVMGDGAQVGFLFGRRGMLAESASSWFLPRLVGMTNAADWVLTGRMVDAAEARTAGLATRVVPDEELDDAAEALARDVLTNTSRVATALSRQLLWSGLSHASPWASHAVESRGVFDLPAKADVREGVASFLQKRAAAFPMRVPSDYPDYGPRWPGPAAG
ncbi:enoyl-CoA hydratase-related protein [Nocardioides ultimimeridianus]